MSCVACDSRELLVQRRRLAAHMLADAMPHAAHPSNHGRRRLRRRVLAPIVTLAVVALGAGAALAVANVRTVTATASSGATTATASYRAAAGGYPADSSLTLAITSGGAVLVRTRIDLAPDVWPGHRFLYVADVEQRGSPDVVVDLYTGGAHCCSIVRVYRKVAASATYTSVQRDFWDPGTRLEMVGGGYAFLSADSRFEYEFTSFAFSGDPTAIWRLRAGRFVDVTRRFPAQISADAARWWRSYVANRRQGLGLGFIAAWAGDEDLLGKGALVVHTLAAQNAAGFLRSGDGQTHGGSAFITALTKLLERFGYAR
jgi:hypothetical protein